MPLQRNSSAVVSDSLQRIAIGVVSSQFRGNVPGQHGLFLDRDSLKRDAAGFDLDDFVANQRKISESLVEHKSPI